ncbi:hypothetical protein LOTGIDRAFT_114942 [Lottia gigantea]|uniref:Uncharacterized protein n=1 Tax=Lottia gigantea TaxID=225164 RepID=V4AJY1_LOTGI|nr:hypothetical protein LOTGIDRAFT_114942 [Lottia gigantea]ESO97397.1 hypothetical protein LOTGIDRAFT_114942 [Lottia gigantea]
MDCEQNLEKIGSLKYFRRYTYKGCLLECLTKYVVNMCSCVTEYIVHNTTDVPYCTPFQRQDCVLPITRQFYLDSSNSNNITDSCVCPRPCSETKYITDLSSGTFPSIRAVDKLIAANITQSLEHARNNLLKVTISFKDSMVEHIYHEPNMSISDTVSIIGGLMGFCLGASILSIVEFVETVFWCILTLISTFIKQNKRVGPKQSKATTMK